MSQNVYGTGDMAKENTTAGGAYLNGNPWLDQMVQGASRDVSTQFMNDIAPALASQFSLAGRTGSGAHANAFGAAATGLAGKLGDISTGIRGNAYNMERGFMQQADEAERHRRYDAYMTERQRQYDAFNTGQSQKLQIAGIAPNLMAMDYQGADKLMQSGDMQQALAQAALDRRKSQYDTSQMMPWDVLQRYSSILNGATGYATTTNSGSGSATQPYNRLTGGIGGGLGEKITGASVIQAPGQEGDQR